MKNVIRSDKGQAMPEKTIKMDKTCFEDGGHTSIYWVGNAGSFINSHGTIIAIDPMLKGFDMPLLVTMPIDPMDIPHIDGYLISHIDNDHFSKDTIKDVKDRTDEFHASHYVASQLEEVCHVNNATGHDIGDEFTIGNMHVKVTPAWHNWQNDIKKWQFREWKREEYCGFWIDTPDGSVWYVGDSRLLDEQMNMPVDPDVILFDFSDNPWHITFDGAVKLANRYPNAILIPVHWGTVDGADYSPFNGDPERLAKAIVNPERIAVLNIGDKYVLK